MNDRRLSDARVAAALRRHAPTHAPAGLRQQVSQAALATRQQRPLPSFLGVLFDADPRARRRSLLVAVALLLALALAGVAGVGAWRLLQRDVVPRALNGWIAYVMQPTLSGNGPADIYLVRDGVEPRVIVGGDYGHGHNSCPSFSPDGSRLAYAEAIGRESDGTWAQQAVVVIEVDAAGSQVGSEIRIPVSGPGYAGLPCPKWSSDGGSVGYLLTDTGYEKVAITTLNGDTTMIPAPDFGQHWQAFAWSPIGDVIAASEASGSGVWLVPTDGGEPRLLRAGNFRDLAWSPDGSRIAAASSGGPYDRVRVLRVDGTAADVDLGDGEKPVWSPNGDRIAYVKIVEVSPGTFGSANIVVHPDGSDAHGVPDLSDPASQEPWGGSSDCIWSPDGRRLLCIGGYSTPVSFALISVSVTGDFAPLVLTPPTMDLYAARSTDLSWQPVFP